jgi:DNA repair protein RadC
MKMHLTTVEFESGEYTEESISSPEAVWAITKDLFDDISERMLVVVLSSKNNAQSILLREVAIGGHNNMYMTPRDVMVPVLLTANVKFILVHNHPSNDFTPSEEDLVFTRKIVKGAKICGLQLVDHVISTAEGYFSFKKEGLLD